MTLLSSSKKKLFTFCSVLTGHDDDSLLLHLFLRPSAGTGDFFFFNPALHGPSFVFSADIDLLQRDVGIGVVCGVLRDHLKVRFFRKKHFISKMSPLVTSCYIKSSLG